MNDTRQSATYTRLLRLAERLQSQDVPIAEKEDDAIALGHLVETLLYVKDHGVDTVSMMDENEFSNMSDETWYAMCDELGDYDIVYRLGVLYSVATCGDGDMAPAEQKAALGKLVILPL